MVLNLQAFGKQPKLEAQSQGLNLRAFKQSSTENLNLSSFSSQDEEQKKRLREAQQRALDSSEKAKWLNSPAGLFIETAKEVFQKVGRFAADPKKLKKTGETLAREISTNIGVRMAASLDRILTDGKPKEFVPESKIEKILFGDEPIYDYKEEVRRAAISFGASEERAEELSIPLAIAFATLDVIPPFKITAKGIGAVSKNIAKTTDLQLIVKELKNVFKGGDDELLAVAEGFVKANNPKEIESVLTGIVKEQDALKTQVAKLKGGKEAPIDALARIAKRFKTKQEFNEFITGKGYSEVKDILKNTEIGDLTLAWNKANNLNLDGSKSVIRSATKTADTGLDALKVEARKYTSASDFAKAEFEAKPTQQFGLVDSKKIVLRDPTDPVVVAEKVKAIQSGKKLDPLQVEVVDGKIITIDGSNTGKAYQEIGLEAPVVVRKGQIEGLSTLEDIYKGAGKTVKKVEPRKTPVQKKADLEKAGAEALEESQVSAEAARLERDLFSKSEIADINKLKTMSRSKAFIEGDIETLRKANPKLVDRVVESVREAKQTDIHGIDMSDVEALEYALSLPTKLQATAKIPAEIIKARSLSGQVKTFMQGVREGTISTKRQIAETQKQITKLIRESSLDLKDKGKFLSSIKNVQTREQLQRALPRIVERIDRLESASTVRNLRYRVVKELKTIKPFKGPGISRGKFTAETQRTLDEIKSAFRIKRSEALAEASDLAIANVDNMTPEIARKIDILRMAGGLSRGNTGFTQTGLAQTLANVRILKTQGRTINEIKAIKRLKEQTATVKEGLTALGGAIDPKVAGIGIVEPYKGIRGALHTVDNWLQGVDTLLDKLSIFDKANTGRLDGFLNKKLGELVHNSRQAQNKGLRVWTEEIQSNFQRIWKEEGRKLAKIVNDNKKETVVFKVGNQSRNLSPNQIYKKWMEMQDPTLEATFKAMGWGDEQFKFINDYMSKNPKLKAWAEWQLNEFYPKYGKTIAPIYETRFNMPFSAREAYSPIRRSTVDIYLDAEKSLLDNAYHMASNIPGSLKSRVKNVHGLEFVDGDSVLISHFTEMEHFKAFDETIRTWRGFFKDPSIRATITEKHGSDILRNVNHLIDNIARDGIDAAATVRFLDTLRGNFTRAVLGLNPTVTLKQLASIPAYITEMPGGAIKGTGEFFKLQTSFWKNPIKNTRTLMKSEMMKARYSNMERDIKQLMRQGTAKRVLAGKDSFLNKTMITVRSGDRGAILQGGWAIYKSNFDNLIKKGVSRIEAHKEALRIFERVTVRTQQAGEIENLARLQTTGGSFGKLFTMFLTAPNQYYRMASRSLRNLRYRVGSKSINLRNLVISWVVLPSIFQFVSDGFRVDPKRQARAVILGPLNGIPVVGENLEDVVRAFTGDDVFSSSAPPPLTISGKLATTLARAIKKIRGQDMTQEDVWKTIEDMAIVGGQFTGVPTDPAIRQTKGLASFITGKTDDPRSIIFSEYALGDEESKGESGIEIPSVNIPSVDIPSVDIPSISF
jgi:hypothetical protein